VERCTSSLDVVVEVVAQPACHAFRSQGSKPSAEERKTTFYKREANEPKRD